MSWASIALSVLCAMGCAPEEDPCPPLEACDIRASSCQERALRTAACLREQDASEVSVEVQVIDADVLIDEIVSSQKEERPDPDEVAFRAALSWFELSRPRSSERADLRETYDNVAAFYANGRVTVLDRGTPLDSPGATSVLVHELVHALQDANGAFRVFAQARTWDEWLAARAMIEGEATFHELRAYLEIEEREGVDFDQLFAEYQDGRLSAADEAEDPWLLAPLLFPYAWGGEYLADAFSAGGGQRIRDVLAHAPRTTRQVIAGYDAVPEPGEAWRDPLGRYTVAGFEGAKTSSVSHLGAWMRWQFARRLGLSEPLFKGALDDSFTVLDGKGGPFAVWRFRFASEAVARRARSELVEGGLTAQRDGADVWLIAHAADAGPAPDRLAWSKQTGEDFGFETETTAHTRCLLGVGHFVP